MKTLVVGLGNPILSDDGVGIHVVQAIKTHITPDEQDKRNDVSFVEASVGGLRLMEIMVGYERVILIDAIQTQAGTPGNIYRIGPNDLRVSLHSGSTHDFSLLGALAFGRGTGMALPKGENITIIAIEVQDVLNFGETCTPCVAAAIPRAVEAVLAELAT